MCTLMDWLYHTILPLSMHLITTTVATTAVPHIPTLVLSIKYFYDYL